MRKFSAVLGGIGAVLAILSYCGAEYVWRELRRFVRDW